MKKLPLVIAMLLVLVSCIPVDDFGGYWDKAGIDKRLAGNWKHVAASPDQTRERGYGIGDIMQFIERDGVYEFSSEDSRSKGEPPMPARTITAGPYDFLAIARENKGAIQRYKVGASTFEFCLQNGPALVDFVKANFPRAANMKKNKGEGSYITIALFNDEVAAVLSAIPNRDPYWICDQKFERVP